MTTRSILAPVLLAFSLAFSLGGCGSAVRTSAQGVEIAALSLATAGDAISIASEADARSTCPAGSALECLEPVSARWAPVDEAFALASSAVGAWYGATLLASRAGSDLLGAALEFASRFAGAYAALVVVASRAGVPLPQIPAGVLP
jgi:hypothetical protein